MLYAVALWGSILIFSLSLGLHVLVLFKVIHYSLVWGGRLKSDSDMYRFEAVSIFINCFLLLVVLMKADLLLSPFSKPILTGIHWFMVPLFVLNTFGNIWSKNKLERMLFSPITALLAFFAFILAIS